MVTRCAQITPLTGGKKDTVPPKAISYYPENASLNFQSKTIEVSFDEYITIKDIANQFIITPQTREMPEIEASGKKLKITFNESLLPNTTYKLAFGNAIADLNESNILQNFEYIFSTGPSIDSMKLSGRIYNSSDLKPASQVLVGLYNKDANDSIIYKDKPLYIAKTDGDGNFKFNYLPHTPFRIAAIKDANKNLMYDGSEEQLAYIKNLVTPGDSGNISLALFKEIPAKSFIKKSYSVEYGKAYIIYNKPQTDIKEVLAKGLQYYKQTPFKDTLILYYTNKYDTLETFVKYTSKKTDTLYIKLITASTFEKQIKNKAIKYNLQANFSTALPFYQLPAFDLNVPADSKNLTEDKLLLIEKTDSVSKKLPVKILKENGWITSFKVQADFKPETSYTLTILKGVISDNAQRLNDSASYQFKTTATDDHAQLKMKMFFPKKEKYIVMLLNDKDQVVDERLVEFSLTSTSEKIVEYKNLNPGLYSFKVAEDVNKNGLFDTGDYFSDKQPETIFVNPTPIKLLAGWEIENEWIIK